MREGCRARWSGWSTTRCGTTFRSLRQSVVRLRTESASSSSRILHHLRRRDPDGQARASASQRALSSRRWSDILSILCVFLRLPALQSLCCLAVTVRAFVLPAGGIHPIHVIPPPITLWSHCPWASFAGRTTTPLSFAHPQHIRDYHTHSELTTSKRRHGATSICWFPPRPRRRCHSIARPPSD